MVRYAITGVLVQLVLVTVCAGSSPLADTSTGGAPWTPTVVLNLAKIGWAPPPSESNRTFFKDFTLGKLFALDDRTRVVFLNEDLIVVYHTRHDGKEWRTAPRFMEAFFLRAQDGSLLSKQSWPTGLRKSLDDRIDSQSRLIPLDGGRFVVFTNAMMTLYGPDLKLLKQHTLEPSTSTDYWGAQTIDSGKGIVLRHESTLEPTYLWLTSDTLQANYQMQAYRGRDYSIGAGVAGENSVFERARPGILMIDRDQRVKTICDDPLCRESGSLCVLSTNYLGWSGRSGIGIVDRERGLVWSKLVHSQYQHKGFQFGDVQPARSGTKFALWVTANKRAFFDEVEIKAVTILVYDFANLKERPSVLRIKPIRPDWCFALSPNGTKMAVFDGSNVQIYLLN